MRRIILFFLLPVLFLLSCQVSDEEKIYHVLDRRQEALQHRDLPQYLSCISKAYQNNEEDSPQLAKRMAGYFKTFDRITYSSWDRSVQINGETATVTQQVHFEVEKEGKKKSFFGKERLFFKKEGRGWKIIKGL